ncbi:MAG TPA: DUF4097 family beta strand repeat-containing protein [Bacteroidota bacterium]|nr:DUF4097 family beta strand repeat-containing protein [Bacteroidota bacterium]
MKHVIRIFTLIFFSGCVIGLLAQTNRSKSFSVGKGGTLEISTSVGDLHIKPWDKNEVAVSVEGLEDEELDRVKMTQTGNTIRVTYRSRWNNQWGENVVFDAYVPQQFILDLSTSGGNVIVSGTFNGKIDGSTSGGDIKLGDVSGGPVEVTTSGGNITTGAIQGDGTLKTSGGDIEVGKVSGQLSVYTSGGNIRVTTVQKSLNAKTAGGDIEIGDVGGEAAVSTSGGNVIVGKVSGNATLGTAGGDIELRGASGKVKAHTSGGDVHLEDITGSVDARTSGGEVSAELIPSGKGGSQLSSSGGNIRLYISPNVKATIDATIRLNGWGFHKSQYVVRSEFPKDSYETDTDDGEIHAVYKLNGGGELIELNTVNSDIEIHKLTH